MKEQTLSPLGQYIVQKMQERGYVTQNELAVRSRLPCSTISAYVHGIFFPSGTKAKKLAKALGVDHAEMEQLRSVPFQYTGNKYERILGIVVRLETAQSELEHKVKLLSERVAGNDKLIEIMTLLAKRQ